MSTGSTRRPGSCWTRDRPLATLVFAELVRRKGFEYNGMVLHEGYFEAMKPTSGDSPASLASALQQSFGSVEKWKEEFTAIGKLRGVGWAVLFS